MAAIPLARNQLIQRSVASGSAKSARFNTMILGGYLKVKPIVAMENVMAGLKKSLPERAWALLPKNQEAIMHGAEIIRRVR